MIIYKNDRSGRYYEHHDEVPWSERPHWFLAFALFTAAVLFFAAIMFGVIAW